MADHAPLALGAPPSNIPHAPSHPHIGGGGDGGDGGGGISSGAVQTQTSKSPTRDAQPDYHPSKSPKSPVAKEASPNQVNGDSTAAQQQTALPDARTSVTNSPSTATTPNAPAAFPAPAGAHQSSIAAAAAAAVAFISMAIDDHDSGSSVTSSSVASSPTEAGLAQPRAQLSQPQPQNQLGSRQPNPANGVGVGRPPGATAGAAGTGMPTGAGAGAGAGAGVQAAAGRSNDSGPGIATATATATATGTSSRPISLSPPAQNQPLPTAATAPTTSTAQQYPPPSSIRNGVGAAASGPQQTIANAPPPQAPSYAQYCQELSRRSSGSGSGSGSGFGPGLQGQGHRRTSQAVPLPASANNKPPYTHNGGAPGRSFQSHAGPAIPRRSSLPDESGGGAFEEECRLLNSVLSSSSREAVRRCVRDNWNFTLYGSDHHIAFLTNAMMHNAPDQSLRNSVRDFGQRLVHKAPHEIAKWLTTDIIDAIAPRLLDLASDKFLDQAMARRLVSIPARPLLNALAEARRLGYDRRDIIPDDSERVLTHIPKSPGENGESCVTPDAPEPAASAPAASAPVASATAPNIAAAAAPVVHAGVGAGVAGAPAASRPTVRRSRCHLCGFAFTSEGPKFYHVSKAICQNRTPATQYGRWRCYECNQYFSGQGGLNYHTLNGVCLDRYVDNKQKKGSAGLSAGGGIVGQGPAQPPPPSAFSSFRHPPPQAQPAQTYSLQGTMPSAAPPSTAPALIHSDVSWTPVATQAAGLPPTPSSQPLSGQSSTRPNDDTVPNHVPAGLDEAYARLSPEARRNLDHEMELAELQFKQRVREARETIPVDQLEARLASLKGSFATKQSMIRKKYGVRLRNRRNAAQMAAERSRIGLNVDNPPSGRSSATPQPRKSNLPGSSSFSLHDVQHATKKARVNEGGDAVTTQSSQQASPRLKTLSLSQMSAGLAGSQATAATEDPTAFATPSRRPPSERKASVENGHRTDQRRQGSQRLEVFTPATVSHGVTIGVSSRAAEDNSRQAVHPDARESSPIDIDSSSDSEGDIPA